MSTTPLTVLPDRRKHEIGIALGLIILLGVFYTWGIWRFFTTQSPGGNDFLAHYTAWEAYLQHGINPYSDEAALYTQQVIYGRPAQAGEDQNRLTYPYYSILIHAPFTLLPFPLARAIYMVLLQAALIVGVAMLLDVFRWRIQSVFLLILLAWGVLFYPAARGIILGQFAIFGFFSLSASLYLLNKRKDAWAGVVLVLSTIKPTLIFLVIPFLMIWGFRFRRWRFLSGFLVFFSGLLLGSFIALPTWLSDMLFRIETYTTYTVGQSPVWLLSHVWLPQLGQIGEILLVLVFIILMLLSWRPALQVYDEPSFFWAIGTTLLISTLIVPRSATTNYVLLYIPTLLMFSMFDKKHQYGRKVILVALLISFLGLWWLHLATVVGNQEQAVMFIPYPLILAGGWIYVRRWLIPNPESQQGE